MGTAKFKEINWLNLFDTFYFQRLQTPVKKSNKSLNSASCSGALSKALKKMSML